ncbi:MAG: DNA polymerase III subunit gamma/tau [Acidithiobacillus sp.]
MAGWRRHLFATAMSAYLALARRWRPQQFADFVGQEAVVSALRHALDSGRIHHAFLFTGTRGVGKTTVARLLAKCLNCEQGVSSTPCGECSACRSIAAGNFVDLIEVDAASRTRVDETRELLDNVQYAPSIGRYKVYLIDEVHMLSTHSFNALLKTLEEPPEHVKFLLATTDPQKLPITILSRCLQFTLRRLSVEQIQGRMEQILSAEGIAAEVPALRHLARAADGSLRDALSLLDQAIVHGGGSVRLDAVVEMLGQADGEILFHLLAALAADDAVRLFTLLEDIQASGMDAAGLLDGVIEWVHRASLAQFLPVSTGDVDGERMAALAQSIPPLEMQALYYLLLSARRDFPLYPNARMALEMAFLRLLSFRRGDDMPSPTAHRQPVPTQAATASSGAAAVAGRSADAGSEGDWGAVLQGLDISASLRAFLAHGRAQRCDGEAVILAMEPAYLALAEAGREALERALTRHFGSTPALSFRTLETEEGGVSLAQEEASARAAWQLQAEAQAAADPTVRALMDQFAARIESVRIVAGGEPKGPAPATA